MGQVDVLKPSPQASVATGVTEACSCDDSLHSDGLITTRRTLSDNDSVVSEISNEPYDRIRGRLY